ncbi:MAG: hypothetical protein MR910_03935, partial [Clostridiales bacterium]|nr:hypothetical protein [Clostridiales bacterium]
LLQLVQLGQKVVELHLIFVKLKHRGDPSHSDKLNWYIISDVPQKSNKKKGNPTEKDLTDGIAKVSLKSMVFQRIIKCLFIRIGMFAGPGCAVPAEDLRLSLSSGSG